MGKLSDALELGSNGRISPRELAAAADIPVARVRRYLKGDELPPSPEIDRLCEAAGVTPTLLRLALGKLDGETKRKISQHAREIERLIAPSPTPAERHPLKAKPSFRSKQGRLYRGDCVEVLKSFESESIDMVFADPPFNLKKAYPSKMNDDLDHSVYLDWTEKWLCECIRLLKPGGSLFVWNLPKWNTHVAAMLNGSLTFKHWIAVDMKFSLPIAGRLYPSHYSLLYYCKGDSAKTFHPDRLPMETCPHCYGDLRDYGGYKSKMNPRGVSLTDVWFDIPPVRHTRYKKRKGANELSLRLMDRIVELSTDEGDTILDPFGGSGTTYVAAELKGRKWVGIELGPVDGIVQRLRDISSERQHLERIRSDYNHLFSERTAAERAKRGLWTTESVRGSQPGENRQQLLSLEDSRS